jgi:hypothetical protein
MNQQSNDTDISAAAAVSAAMLFKTGNDSSEFSVRNPKLASVHNGEVELDDNTNNNVQMDAPTTTTTTTTSDNICKDQSHVIVHEQKNGFFGVPFTTNTAMARKKRKRHGPTLSSTGLDMDEDGEMIESNSRISCSMSLSLSGSSFDEDDDVYRSIRVNGDGDDNDVGATDDFIEGEASISEDGASVITAKTSNITEKSSPPPRQQQQQHANGSHAEHEEQDHQSHPQHPAQKNSEEEQNQHQQPEGWRVKLYRLNSDGSWDDCGTGRILCIYKSVEAMQNDENDIGGGDAWVYRELGEPTLCMHSEVSTTAPPHGPQLSSTNTPSRILLRTRILLQEAYQRQGENIITWCEPYLEEGNPSQGVDLALSFQDHAGCMDIWKQVTHVQAQANELIRARGKGGSSVPDMTHAGEGARHADLQREDQQETWASVVLDVSGNRRHAQNHPLGNNGGVEGAFGDSVSSVVDSYRDSNPGNGTSSNIPQLPNPPTLSNLEGIADTIAAVQVRSCEEDRQLCCIVVLLAHH